MGVRVALVNVGPLSAWCKSPNFGLLFIAAHLQKQLGIVPRDILFADQCAGDDVLQLLASRDWDVVGLSASSVAADQLNALVPKIRHRWPDRWTVLGGVHVSALPKLALKQSHAHFGLVGEGERSFAQLVAGLNETGQMAKNVPGLVWLEDGELGRCETLPEPVEDMDAIPPLALETLKHDYYFKDLVPIAGTNIPALPWLTSRGCVFRCRFCCVNVICNGAVRFFSAERVLDDLERLVRDYGIHAVMFVDDNFVVNRRRLKAICAGILDRPVLRGLRWGCNARADCVNVDILTTMKEAGCVEIAFGFESASQRILTYLKKGGVKVDHARKAISACHQAGIRVQGMFMLGSPGETKENVLETLSFIREHPIDFVCLFTTQPWPGSELWDWAVERNVVDPENIRWQSILYDNKPILADSVDTNWLYRRYKWETLRAAFHNYSFPIFLGRAARALCYRITR